MAKATGVYDTPKAVRALQCPADKKQVYFPVAKDIYLYLSVARAGSKSFVYRRKLEGTYHEKHLGKVAGSLDDAMLRESIRQAKAAASEYHVQIERGLNPFDKTAGDATTFRGLFNTYIERHCQKQKKKTISDMLDNFERCFGEKMPEKKYRLADYKVDAITPKLAEESHAFLGQMRGEYMANRAVQLAKPVFNKCKLWKIHNGDNPFSGITLFPEKPRNRFLSPDEVAKLIKAVIEPNGVERHLRDFILLDLLTGVRKSNLLAARWDDFDLQNGEWCIPETKNGEPQIVPLGGNELAILIERQALLRAQYGDLPEFVFPGEGRTGHIACITRSWRTLRKRLGLLDCKIHDLRRSLASAMANANVNLALVKSAMNHKDMKTTLRVYANTSKPAELAARETAHAVWFRAAGLLPEEKDNVEPLKRKSK